MNPCKKHLSLLSKNLIYVLYPRSCPSILILTKSGLFKRMWITACYNYTLDFTPSSLLFLPWEGFNLHIWTRFYAIPGHLFHGRLV